MPNAKDIFLPNAKGKTTANKSITLAVTADYIYSINNVELNKAAVKSKLANEIAKAKTEDPTIVLKLDKSLNLENFVDILKIGDELNVKMILATKPTK